jgi:hypothetical protein
MRLKFKAKNTIYSAAQQRLFSTANHFNSGKGLYPDEKGI